MRRFICNPQDIVPPQIKISDKSEIHHIKDVLRLKAQDKIIVLDGQGSEFICRINQIEKELVRLEILEKIVHEKTALALTVACALPKGSKIDSIVEKLTEIGVERIILLKTERTEFSLKDYTKKTERVEKIADSALKQSGNFFLPKIEVMDFKALLRFKAKEKFDLALLPNLTTDVKDLKSILEEATPKNILLAIGPEGDFSPEEIALANQNGFVPVSLGESVLRVETAAIVAASFIKLYYSGNN